MPNRSISYSSNTKTNQIYSLLRERIFQKRYTSGSKLPSTRDLAGEFGVSRALIVDVYEQLIAEGYLEGRQGSGTYVMDLGEDRTFPAPPHESGYSAAHPAYVSHFDGIDFRPGLPSLELVPYKKLKEAARDVFDQAHPAMFGYHEDPAGSLELRENISRHLLHTKGIQCSPSQIIVTAGATQAISLLCQLIIQPGDGVVTEDPTSPFIHHIFASAGADMLPVPVDDHGLRVDEIPAHHKPKCVFVTPSHQFPLGSILSIGRRIQLLEYARQTGCYIIEDDYDSEFRYTGMPVHALRELDAERVVYVGTFSKNLFPALRLGYMVVPTALLTSLLHIKQQTDRHCPTLSQITLASFIESGHLERHIARMKRIYGKRRNRLITSLTETFGKDVRISGDAAGLHLVAEFSGLKFDSDAAARLEKRNIKIYPAERYSITPANVDHRLILGFGNVAESDIGAGVKGIADEFL